MPLLSSRFCRVLAALFAVAAVSAEAQQPGPLLACRANLDSLAEAVARNYAGFLLEVTGGRRTRHDEALDRLRPRADAAAGGDCYIVLRDYVEWFADPHLFVFQSTRIDSAVTRHRMETMTSVAAPDEAAIRATLGRRPHLDPLEGIWYDAGLRVAIVADDADRRRFTGIVLRGDTPLWTPGMVRARFRKTRDGYDADVWSPNAVLRHHRATLHKRVLLRLSPGIWGKAYPVTAADSGLVDPVDAHRATLVIRGTTPVISIPSHDPTYKGALDSLLRRYDATLHAAPRLIIDLRGNEGGSSWITNGLRRFFASETPRPGAAPDLDESMMLSSADQIDYARRAFGSDTTRFVRSLVERLQASPGALVRLQPPDRPAAPTPVVPVVRGSARVGVMIDRGTVSAAEVTVLQALRSDRATVFGRPTAGALDYQSVNIVPIAAGEKRWYLGYPTITATPRLPTGGMRGKGIRPDVSLDFDRLADPIAAVEARLAEVP